MASAVEQSLPPEPVDQPAPSEESALVPAGQPQKQSHKSWRKKYYKMRHEFQKLMTRNHTQFEEEQKAMRMARRLQEQNDQLLDLLSDINKAPRLPTKFRYDIRSPVPTSGPIAGLEDDDLELEDSLPYNPLRALSRLEAVPHTSVSDLPVDPQERKGLDDFIEDEPTGYLSPAHEEEYLAAIDAHEPNSVNEHTNKVSAPTGPWSARDPSAAAAKNPVSVFNWLRKHEPTLLETSEKGAGAATTTKEEKLSSKSGPMKVMPKRASVGGRHEYGEVLEDDGTVTNGAAETATPSGPGRGRKRALPDDDGAYRPKGGSGRKKKKSFGEKTGAPASSVASEATETAPDA